MWDAFLRKAGLPIEQQTQVDAGLKAELVQRPLNGREIKNVIKTATVLAALQGRTVEIHDILEVLRATDGSEIEELE